MSRPTTLWSADPNGPAAVVYADEVSMLNQDVLFYGNVYFKTDAQGVAVRIDPRFIKPKEPREEPNHP